MERSTNPFYRKAQADFRQAIEADEQGKSKVAFERYSSAVEYFLMGIRYDKSTPSRVKTKQLIRSLLKRAERLQALLASQAAAAPANTERKSSAALAVDDILQRNSGQSDLTFRDVAGMDSAKQALIEAAVLPNVFPQMFTGARRPWDAVLMFGPPGTGKTLLAQAVAKECNAQFVAVSAADLMSKYTGEGERTLKELFTRVRGSDCPVVLFLDEVDSIGRARVEGEDASMRRMKTELLTQLDGLNPQQQQQQRQQRVLFLAATNAPWELDSALRRRFQKRVLVPLPVLPTRRRLLELHLDGEMASLTSADLDDVARATDGMSGADLAVLCREALMLPLRRAMRATHFRQVAVPASAEGTPAAEQKQQQQRLKFTPCAPRSRGAQRMSVWDIETDALWLQPLSRADLLAAASSVKASCGASEVAQHYAWADEFAADSAAAARQDAAAADAASLGAARDGAGVARGSSNSERKQGDSHAAASNDRGSERGGVFSAVASFFSSLLPAAPSHPLPQPPAAVRVVANPPSNDAPRRRAPAAAATPSL